MQMKGTVMQPIRTPETKRPERTGSTRRRPTTLDRHRVAVVQAEARRIARILQPFGVLRKDDLKRRARAASWHEGSFETALDTAVASGEIERLPLGFYKTAERKPGPRSA